MWSDIKGINVVVAAVAAAATDDDDDDDDDDNVGVSSESYWNG